jgi:uncharacterized membrane protein YkoI
MKTLTAVLLVVAIAGPAFTAENKIQMKDLPAALQRAVQQEEAKGATIKNIVAEKEGSKTMYEIETLIGGHSRNLIFDATGTIVEVEEEVAIDRVPAPVRAALEDSGHVIKVERLTKGTKVTYEVQIEKNGKKSDVTVDGAGKRIKD